VLDIFWTFADSLYNSVYKIIFIASSAYTVYLMLNDYKPTHDPNIDTFKVQYLLGGSAVLAILRPSEYSFVEVRSIVQLDCHVILMTRGSVDPMDVLDLAGVCRNPAAALHASENGGGGNNHNALYLRPRGIPDVVYPELVVQILR
jgi:hypothetical protein